MKAILIWMELIVIYSLGIRRHELV